MTTQLEMYLENLAKYSVPEVTRNPIAWEIAKRLQPGWFIDTYTRNDEGGAYQEHFLDNYPGQHLAFRLDAYNEALEIIEMVKKDGGSSCSCGGSCGCKL